MKEKKKALVNLIISALLLFCALFVAATSFGWFAFNDRVDGSGMGAVIRKDESNVTIEYYKINSNKAYEFIKVNESEATLGRYNLLNDKYQMLAKVSVKTDSPVTITATTSVNYYMGSNDAFKLLAAKSKDEPNVPKTGTATIDGTTIEYTNSLSSVVSFACLSKNTNATDYASATDGNGYTLASLPERSRFRSLVDKNNNTIVNTVKVCENLTPDSETVTVGGNTTTNYYVIIVFSYDEDQMSMVFSRNLNNELLSEATEDVTLPFLCDFSITVTQ